MRNLLTIALVTLSSSVFAQFVVFNNGSEVTVTTGCIVTVKTGDLDNDSGVIDNAGRITVEGDLQNDGTVTGGGTSTAIFNVSGDWINNATFTADQSLVNLNGASQLVGGTVTSDFYNLHLLGSGVKSLGLDATVIGTLDLSSFELATDIHTLRVLNTSSSAVVENGGFVSSIGNGRMEWNTNSTDTYIFPLGSSVGTSRVRPISIEPASASANTFAARMANVDATSEGYDVAQLAPELCFVNDQFYHLIERTTGTDAATISQYYVSADDGPWSNGAHWQGTPQWEDMGNETLSTIGGYDVVTNPNWTDFSEPAFVLGNQLPDVAISAVSPLCSSADVVQLNATPSGGSYTGPGISNGIFDPAGAGEGTHTITYTYSDVNGCTNSAEIQVEVNDAPEVEIVSSNNGALELCDGATMELTASAGFVDYEWNTAEQTQEITVTEGGQYSVVATDANGCEATSVVANVTVQENPAPVISANGPVEFCEGEQVVLSTAPNQGAYDWAVTGGVNPTTIVEESGDYFVTVTNQFGCVGVSNTVTVDVTPMDEAVIIPNGNDLTVDPPGTDYQWFLNGDPIPNIDGIDYTAIQSGNYHVEYIGPNGCPTSTDLLEFTLQVGIEEASIFDELNVYPNPGKGEFTISGQLPSSEDVTIELVNMLGQSLQPAVRISSTSSFTQRMDISQVANGVYFVRIMAADSIVTVRYIKS